jgi:hypothetical protein
VISGGAVIRVGVAAAKSHLLIAGGAVLVAYGGPRRGRSAAVPPQSL